MIAINPDKTDILINTLTALWETSVRATHHFRSENDIQKLIPFVTMRLSDITTLIVVYNDNKPIAFIGITGG